MSYRRRLGDERRGDAYDTIGVGYASFRRPDHRIARLIADALGDAETVLSVGSGTGSYEPPNRSVVGVEPSTTMIRQRPAGSAPVVRAVAEHLPFGDRAFDAALAVFTIHHWRDPVRGFDEVERVAPRRIFLTWNHDVHWRNWLFTEYLPEIPELERSGPAEDALTQRFPGSRIEVVMVPWDCTDGFCTAYWRRPERYLDPGVRSAISSFARLDPASIERALGRLRGDLESGSWAARHGDLLARDSYDCGLRLVVSDASRPS